MAAKKKTSDRKMTSPSKAGIRRREKATGTPKQSATKIARRAQAERGAIKRVGSVTKKIGKLNAQLKAGKISGAAHGKQMRALRKAGAKAARLSKSAGGRGG